MDALKRLLNMAAGDTGGSRRAAAFVLSLWAGDTFKADLQELLYVDKPLHDDMNTVFNHLFDTNQQLDSLVSGSEMEPILRAWGNVFKLPDNDFDYSTFLVER